jgi:hypothetical protein
VRGGGDEALAALVRLPRANVNDPALVPFFELNGLPAVRVVPQDAGP